MRAFSKDAYRRYNNSEKGQARRKRYEERHPNRYGRSQEYLVERYHRLQEEACCHCHIRSFFPAYRLLKSLEKAEVVKI